MAKRHSNMGGSAPIPALEDLVQLTWAYEAFHLLVSSEDGCTSPVPLVMAELNKRLRSIVEKLDEQGLLP